MVGVTSTACGADPDWHTYPSWCNGDHAHTNIPSGNRPYTTYASADNSIYGASNYVQPKNVSLLPIIKY